MTLKGKHTVNILLKLFLVLYGIQKVNIVQYKNSLKVLFFKCLQDHQKEGGLAIAPPPPNWGECKGPDGKFKIIGQCL